MEPKRSEEQVIADVLKVMSEIKARGKEDYSKFLAILNTRTQELATKYGRKHVMNFKLWWVLSGMTLSPNFNYGPEPDLPGDNSLEKFVHNYAAELEKPQP